MKLTKNTKITLGILIATALSGGVAFVTRNAKTDAGKRLHDRAVEVNEIAKDKLGAATKAPE